MNSTGKTNDSGQGKEPLVERKRTLKAEFKESASAKRERTMSKEQLESFKNHKKEELRKYTENTSAYCSASTYSMYDYTCR